MIHPTLRHPLLATALTFSTHAADWTGAADTNYNNALNWTPEGVPATNADIAVASGTAVRTGNLDRAALSTVSDTGALTVTGGRFLNANGGPGTFNMTGGSLDQTGNYFIVALNNTGTLDQSGGIVTSTVDRGWFLSDALSSVGTYNLTGGNLNVTATGGNDTNWNIHVGKGAGNDLFLINGGTASFTATAANFQTYISKSGVMQLDSGSATFTGMRYFTVGRNLLEGSTSKLIINDGSLTAGSFDNSAAASPAAFIVGNNNAGEVQINGGTLDISTASLWIGDGSRPGSFLQAGGTLTFNGPTFAVGRTTRGTFSATGGIFNGTLSGEFTMGNVSPDDRMTVDGGDVTLTGAGGNRVYVRGNSVLTVESGEMEVRNFQYFSIGRDLAGTAKVVVNGGRLEVAPATDRTAALVVGGQGGHGELHVNGGELKVTAGPVWVGDGLSGKFFHNGGITVIEGPLVVGHRGAAEAPGNLALDAGSLTASFLQLPTANGSAARLDGGTLDTGYIQGGALPSGTVHFNGTQLNITGEPFGLPVIYQLEHAYLGSGGLVLNLPAGQEASIDQVLEHSPEVGSVKDGGFRLQGGGTVFINQATAYTGRTDVAAGRLSLMFPSLDDRSEVTVVPGAVLELAHAETDVVRRVVLNGQQLATGIWGGPSSSAPNKHALLDGSGLLQVTNGAEFSPFQQWILASGLAPELTGADADGDHDGVANLIEYATGGAAGDVSSRGVATMVPNGGSAVFTIAVRTPATFQAEGSELVASAGGIRYAIQGSADLSLWDAPIEEVTPAVTTGLTSPGAGFELRSFRLSGVNAKGFLRAQVTETP